MGCKSDVCDVIVWELGLFFIVATICHRASGLIWVVVCFYGPADNLRSAGFLDEITALVGAKRAANLPVMVGRGDFNMIRPGATRTTTMWTGQG